MIINLIILALCVLLVATIVKNTNAFGDTPVMDMVNMNKKRKKFYDLFG